MIAFDETGTPSFGRMPSNRTLTLTLSRPTGEGTARQPFSFFRRQSGKYRALIDDLDGERFSLSHWMGEGRGEGNSYIRDGSLLPD